MNKNDEKGEAPQTVTSSAGFGQRMSIIALFISGVSLLISIFTFALQFVAHDAVSYNISQITNATWPTNAYFAISLNVFNRGNRPAALVSANARLIERKLQSERPQITDADCEISAATEQPRVLGLYAGNPDEKLGPNLGAIFKYEAVIEAGKLFTDNLIFRIFAKNDKAEIPQEDKDLQGIVCLDLIFVASKGFTYVTTRAIYGVHFQFEQEKFQVIDAAAFARGDPRRFALVTVIDDRRIELPL
jgi:hypothetical protein